MKTWHIVALLASGVALVLLSVVARTRSNGKYEVKTGDLVLLIIPLLLAALATGKVQGLDLFGVKADLFGMYQAADRISYLNVAGEPGYRELQQFLSSGDEAARAQLAKLPGFVAAKDAVTVSTTKRDALAKMAQLDVSLLPVVDGDHRFVGTVDRSKVTANLILAVTEKVESR